MTAVDGKIIGGKEEISADLCKAVGTQTINVIFDCGSRDALDGINLARRFGARELHVFEPNPVAMALCRGNAAASGAGITITLNEVALGDKQGQVTFRPINQERTQTNWADGNIGASSLFQAGNDYPYEKYAQDEITVEMTTLDSYCLTHDKPDMLWIDVQGAELMLFKGAETVLPTVKVIQVELSFKLIYEGQPLYWEVDRYLRSKGFKRRGFGGMPWWRTAIARLRLPLASTWQANVIYSR